jgi:hypothetical protein
MKNNSIWIAAVAFSLLLRTTVTVTVGENLRSASVATALVWERHGDWHLNGGLAALRIGEAIPAGGLISAGDQEAAHSLTLLFPDGQRMLCECFDPKTCAQGFRVPRITPPSPAVWKMFVGVQNALLTRPVESETVFPPAKGRSEMAAHSEMVAPVEPEGKISISPALKVLPAGEYSMALEAEVPAGAASFPASQRLDWKADRSGAPVRVGGAGLYQVQIFDESRVLRMAIEVLAVAPSSYGAEASGLQQTRDIVRKWSQAEPGWPLHPFLRVYLQSRAEEIFRA